MSIMLGIDFGGFCFFKEKVYFIYNQYYYNLLDYIFDFIYVRYFWKKIELIVERISFNWTFF